jgi:hypothetical protein
MAISIHIPHAYYRARRAHKHAIKFGSREEYAGQGMLNKRDSGAFFVVANKP